MGPVVASLPKNPAGEPVGAVAGGDPEATMVDAYCKFLTIRGIDPQCLTVDASGTMVPLLGMPGGPGQSYGGGASHHRIKDAAWKRPLDDEIDLGETLGEGGMGLVRRAEQRALLREVAVKTVKPEADISAYASLVREARVTGALEHPNVVPVHDLGTDADGAPVLVMKRIEGETWAMRLEQETLPLKGEALEQQLQVLLSVATAMHFAHERGLVHRDIKPDNVMIGRFGEVYLLDWGIAVSCDPRSEEIAPRAADVRGIAGTPAFLAPEMAAADGEQIGPASDVYLLGGMLFLMLTGHPPHDAGNLLSALAQAYAATAPELPADAPNALAAICRRAMDPDPEARYDDAGEFRHALATYLIRRPSLLLVEEARERLDALARVRATMTQPPSPGSVEDQTLRNHFSAARFGLASALRTWTGNADATEVLDGGLTVMAEYELWVGAPIAAQHWLSECATEASVELDQAVSEAVAVRARQRIRWAQLEHDTDTLVSAKQRGWLLGVVGLLWFGSISVIGQLDRQGAIQADHFLFAMLFVVWSASLGLGWQLMLRLGVLRENAANRVLVRAASAALAYYVLLIGVLFSMEVDLTNTIAITHVMGGLAWTLLTITIDWRLFPMAIGVGLGTIPVAMWPAWRFEWTGMSAGIPMLLVGWLWLRSESMPRPE